MKGKGNKFAKGIEIVVIKATSVRRCGEHPPLRMFRGKDEDVHLRSRVCTCTTRTQSHMLVAWE